MYISLTDIYQIRSIQCGRTFEVILRNGKLRLSGSIIWIFSECRDGLKLDKILSQVTKKQTQQWLKMTQFDGSIS